MRYYKSILILGFISGFNHTKPKKHRQPFNVDRRKNLAVNACTCVGVLGVLCSALIICFKTEPFLKCQERQISKAGPEAESFKGGQSQSDDLSVNTGNQPNQPAPSQSSETRLIDDLSEEEKIMAESIANKIFEAQQTIQRGERCLLNINSEPTSEDPVSNRGTEGYPNQNLSAASIFQSLGGDQEVIWQSSALQITDRKYPVYGNLLVRGNMLFPQIHLIAFTNPSVKQAITEFVKSMLVELNLKDNQRVEADQKIKEFIRHVMGEDGKIKEQAHGNYPGQKVYAKLVNSVASTNKKAIPLAIYIFWALASPSLTDSKKSAEHLKKLQDFLNANDLTSVKEQIEKYSFLNFGQNKADYQEIIKNLAYYVAKNKETMKIMTMTMRIAGISSTQSMFHCWLYS